MVVCVTGILLLLVVLVVCIVYACCKVAGDIDEIIGMSEGDEND